VPANIVDVETTVEFKSRKSTVGPERPMKRSREAGRDGHEPR
jgi:hypothetical protein